MVATVFAARADDQPHVPSGTELVFFDPNNAGFMNVRSRPDPRSDIVAKLVGKGVSLRARGGVGRYGDTWWVEVEHAFSGGSLEVGWANARLLAFTRSNEPLQAFVNIDDLAEIAGRSVTGAQLANGQATSFEECARACAKTATCVALTFHKGSSACEQFNATVALVSSSDSISAAKPPVSLGGPTFAQRLEVEFIGEGYLEIIAATLEDCARTCSADARCRAVEYQPRRRVCAHFSAVPEVMPRRGYSVAVRSGELPPVAQPAPLPPTRPPAQLGTSPAKSSGPISTGATYQVLAALVQRVFDEHDSIVEFHIEGRSINPNSGMVTLGVKKVFRPEGRQDGSGGRSLRGDAHDFFPQVDPQNAMRGQLLYAGPSAAPGDVVLLVIERRSAAEVRTWAQLVQKELDHLAQLTNRTIDPIAGRKNFRMRKLNP